MDRGRIRECRWNRDISLIRQDFFSACIAQCEIVKLLEEMVESNVENMEIMQEQKNLHDCISDCIKDLLETKIDDAFCNGLYHEFVLVNWECLEKEWCNRGVLADKYFLETKTDYISAGIFHVVNFQRMEDSKIEKALKRYYGLLKHRWYDCEKTAKAIFGVIVDAIFEKNQQQYYYFFQEYSALLKYLNKKDYWTAWFRMACAACNCKDRQMVVECKEVLEQCLNIQNDCRLTIIEENQFIHVNVLIDLLDNRYDLVIYKCEDVIKKLEYLSIREDISGIMQQFLIIDCVVREYLFQWEEVLLIVQKGMELFAKVKETDRNLVYWFFYLHLGHCLFMLGETDKAYEIFDDIINGGYCKNLQIIGGANCGMSAIALQEQRFDDVRDIYEQMKKDIPETKEYAFILAVCYYNYLYAFTIEDMEFKGEYREIYNKIMGKFLKEQPNDRLYSLTELIYGEYQLKLGLYDVDKIQKVLEDTKCYIKKIPNDKAVREKWIIVQNMLNQREKKKGTKKINWFKFLRR